MTTEVNIAIITAVISLLVSIVSILNSIISNRQNAVNAKNFETLKFELTQKQETKKLSDDFLLRQMESLDALIKVIQRMKDIVQLILNSQGTHLDTESTMEHIEQIRQVVFECYEEQLPILVKEDSNGAHKAKNLALSIETQLKDYLDKTTYVSEMSEGQKQKILELRNALSDAQNLLRDSRMHKLIQRLSAK